MKFEGYVYIYTIGCQMNTYDSERLFILLRTLGYEKTDVLEKADLVICNTCSVREKAQEKAYSFLGRMTRKKQRRPGLVTVMAGCVAQQEGREAFRRVPSLDMVLGTRAYERLPGHIRSIRTGSVQICDTGDSGGIFEALPDTPLLDEPKVCRFVTIMQGCDNFCTYCVVPHVRGRERSRTPESIVEEVTVLAESGVREVTLLGQNVNSYGRKEGILSFAGLLERVAEVPGIARIRFATSHPKDLSAELIRAMGDLDKVCNHLHLPVQSGSDRILKKMNRGYSREDYLDRVSRLREACPGIALTSDMIVGFPSESESDFRQTMDLVRQVEFDGIFAFAYSDRPNAPAVKFPDPVPEEEMLRRLNELLEFQETVTEARNRELIGRVVPVLGEGESRKKRAGLEETDPDGIQMTGRTETSKIVHFCAGDARPGEIVNIKVEQAYPHSLWGCVQRQG